MVFVSGGTGYMGRAVIPELLRAGLPVRVLVREGSIRKVPIGAEVVLGNALDSSTFAGQTDGCHTFLHMVGTPHPAPWKGDQFRQVDRTALYASVAAARKIKHFVYISVAHPAPMMREYIAVRQECEAHLAASGLVCTILRPWYVLGPGHRWPCALIPAYKVAERVPSLRDGARRLGLVTLSQMRDAIVSAVRNPPGVTQILGVPEITESGTLACSC